MSSSIFIALSITIRAVAVLRFAPPQVLPMTAIVSINDVRTPKRIPKEEPKFLNSVASISFRAYVRIANAAAIATKEVVAATRSIPPPILLLRNIKPPTIRPIKVRAVNSIRMDWVALSGSIVSIIFMQIANAPRAMPIETNAAPIDLHLALFAKLENVSAMSLNVPAMLLTMLRDFTRSMIVKNFSATLKMSFTEILSVPNTNSRMDEKTSLHLSNPALILSPYLI